ANEAVRSGGEWSCGPRGLVPGGGVLQLVEPAGRDPRRPMVLRDECPEAVPGTEECPGESSGAAESAGPGGWDELSPFLARSAAGSGRPEEGLPGLAGVSAAHGSGDGVRVPCGGGDEPVLRGDGGAAGGVRVVSEEQQGADLAGGGQEAE